MPDRGRTRSHGSGFLIKGSSRTAGPARTDVSARHCWLMRRNPGKPVPLAHWPAPFKLCPFTLEQAPEVHNLLALGYQNGSGSVPDYSSWLHAFEHDPEFNTELCFVARDDHGPVGVITCWTSAFIKDLVVHPRARRQGVAMALLAHLFDCLHRRGEGQVDLSVMENNLPARNLYEKSGMSYVQRSSIDHL